MTVVGSIHEEYGATFEAVDGRRVVDHYGRPERTHRAVRNAVGIIEADYGIVEVRGTDRVEFVDNAVTNRVPPDDGRGVYALLLDPQGRVRTDMYVYNAGERLLCFTPPARAGPLAEEWAEHVFIQDVTVREATADFGVFGVHGPTATEKLASVLNKAGAPGEQLSFVRGSMDDVGVVAVATDAPTGEEGYEVICDAGDAERVFRTLLSLGNPATPFGYRAWNSLTLEAGTPLFDPDLTGAIPNVAGVRNAVDFEKGCFVGQEVVSRVENRGRPSKRLVGLLPEAVPDAGAPVLDGDDEVGAVTRAVESPSLSRPVALARLRFDCEADELVVGDGIAATRAALPFVEGSGLSRRLPTYAESAEEGA